MDPPYAAGLERRECLTRLARGDVLASGGRIVVETAAREPLSSIDSLDLTRECRYGDTRLAFYRLAGESPTSPCRRPGW